MIPPIDVEAERADLARVLAELDGLRERLGPAFHERAAAVSAWSPAQHAYHLALATDLALRNVAGLARGKAARAVEEGGPNDLAERVLTEGSYPRGHSEAPRMVRPGERVEPEFLKDELARCRAAAAELEGRGREILGAPLRVLHTDLGELSAAEWLRFARLHARHHLAIVTDALAAGDVSAGAP